MGISITGIGDGHFRCYANSAWSDCGSNGGPGGPYLPLAGGNPSGPINSSSTISATGLTAASDGVHSGYDSLVGNIANQAVAPNTAGFMGPASASFTAYALQLPAAGPSAPSSLDCGAPSSSVSGCVFVLGVPVTQVPAAASTAAVSITGTPFTGGSGTTTVPFIYYNSGSTAPTGFSTNGTILGVNAPTSFAGNLIDTYVAGSEIFQVGASGFVRTIGAVQSGGLSSTYTGNVFFAPGAPTISSGFGSGASVVHQNGSAAFTVNVGTGGTASTGVIGMPTAATGWACKVAPNGAPQAAAVTYSAPTSASSITLTNYTLTTGAALPWTASTVLQVSCWGY